MNEIKRAVQQSKQTFFLSHWACFGFPLEYSRIVLGQYNSRKFKNIRAGNQSYWLFLLLVYASVVFITDKAMGVKVGERPKDTSFGLSPTSYFDLHCFVCYVMKTTLAKQALSMDIGVFWGVITNLRYSLGPLFILKQLAERSIIMQMISLCERNARSLHFGYLRPKPNFYHC